MKNLELITPQYIIEPFITILNCDCMDLMAKYPDNYFDLALVDPPYGIGMGKKKTIGKKGKTYSTTTYKQSNWDSKIPDEAYFKELFRVSKDQIIFGANYFTNYLPPSQGWFIYDKRMPENFSMAHAELAFTSFDRAVRMKGVKKTDMQNCVSNNKQKALVNAKIHQCQKPISIYEFILHTYAKENFKILDTHLGSGSSAIASHRAKMQFIGCEIDKEYFEAATKRIKNETLQTTIF